MTGPELDHFLEVAANADTEEKQKQVFPPARYRQAHRRREFRRPPSPLFATTSTQLLPEVRAAMIRDVLEKRMNPAIVPALVDFARSTKDIVSAIAALKAVRSSVGDNQFDPFFSIVQVSPECRSPQGRRRSHSWKFSAKSGKRGEYAKLINTALNSITDSKIREALQRLKTAAGG